MPTLAFLGYKEIALVHLEPSDLADAYRDSEAYSKDFHEPYDEYERLAKNQLNPKTDKSMPKVNDGSLAALMKELPKRVLAQMSTGLVKPKDSDEAWLKELSNIIWNKQIIPNANSQMTAFDKYRLALYRAVVYGGAPIFSFFDGSKDVPSSDFILPDPRSVFLEDGKLSDLDSDYVFMDVWYKKNQIKSIIQSNKSQDGSTWDVKVLSDLLAQSESQKEADKESSTEASSSYSLSGHKLVAVFQRGHKAPFYMFAPSLDNRVARTWANEDATGNLPINYMYNDQDLENPYGLSQIALSGPIQNVLDYLTQSFLLSTQIGLQPPIRIGGDTSRLNERSLVIAPRQKWRIGDATVDTVNTNNSTYTQYPNNYGLIKTQLMNLQGTTDAAVSATSGNPQYSKTPAGIAMQQERTNANDNFLRQNAAGSIGRVFQSMFNLHVANSEGSDIIKLYGTDLQKMQQAGLIDTDPETKEPSTDEVEVIWDNLRGEYTFEVDANSSIGKDDDAKINSMVEILSLSSEDPNFAQDLAASGFKFNKGELLKQIIMKKGADDWEKIIEPISDEDATQMEQEAAAQQMGDLPPEVIAQGETGEVLPPSTQPPLEFEQEDESTKLAVILQGISSEFGVTENEAMAILEARTQGIPDDEIIAYLQGGA